MFAAVGVVAVGEGGGSGGFGESWGAVTTTGVMVGAAGVGGDAVVGQLEVW